MRRVTRWLATLVCMLTCASPAGAQPPAPSTSETQAPPALSAGQQCGVERVALQAQVVELRARVVELQTQLDRQAVERERMRVEGTLPVPAGWRWDWPTLQMVPAQAPATDPTPPKTEPR